MAEQAYAYVTLIPVAKGFQGAIAKELGGVADIGDKSGREAGGRFSSGFGGVLKGLAAVAGTALAGIGISNFFKESISAASDLTESLNAVSVSYGEATQGIVGLAETAANRLGLSQVQFNSIATQFSGFAANIAGPGGDVVGFIDELTTRGADFASVFNLDVDEALRLFQSGLAGETEPLRKFGLDLSAATVEAYAYANGIAESGQPLTEAQKQQARYGALLEQTAKTQGDFSNTSDSLANAQRILGANFANVQATVGGPLLEAFANLTTALIPVVNELGPILVDVMGQLSPVIANIAGQLPGLLTAFFPLIPVIGELATIFFQIVEAILPVLVELIVAIVPIIAQLVTAFLPFVQMILPILVELMNQLLPVFMMILNEVIIPLLPVIMELIIAMLPLIELVLPILIQLLEFLIPIFIWVADLIGVIIVAAIGLLIEGINWLTETFTAFGTFFEDTWNGIKTFFVDVINMLIGAFEAFVNGAIRGINSVIDAINSLSWEVPDWVPEIGGRTFGFDIGRLSEISLPRVALAEGGFVTGPTNALIGEAGPELVIPLDRFERMVGMDGGQGQTVNYYAAPNKSLDAERELIMAMQRARLYA
jgi:hypothetical protein